MTNFVPDGSNGYVLVRDWETGEALGVARVPYDREELFWHTGGPKNGDEHTLVRRKGDLLEFLTCTYNHSASIITEPEYTTWKDFFGFPEYRYISSKGDKGAHGMWWRHAFGKIS